MLKEHVIFLYVLVLLILTDRYTGYILCKTTLYLWLPLCGKVASGVIIYEVIVGNLFMLPRSRLLDEDEMVGGERGYMIAGLVLCVCVCVRTPYLLYSLL